VELGTGSGAGYALIHREPVVSVDLAAEPRFCAPLEIKERGIKSCLAAPMLSGDEAVGVLIVHTRQPRQFSPEEVHFLSLVANQTALALESSRLFAQIEQRARELSRDILHHENRERLVLESVADGVYVTDRGCKVTLWNPAAEQITGYKAEEVLGRHCAEVIKHTDDEDNSLCYTPRCPLQEAMTRGEPTPTRQLYMSTVKGQRIPVAVVASPLRNAEGEVIGAVEAFRDISREKEIDRMKSEFVSVVSHELRTPLASLQGFSELLLKREVPPEKQREWLTIMNQEAQNLGRLIDDLLDLSRIEAGRIELHPEPVDMEQMLQERVQLFQSRTTRHALKMEVPPGLPPVRADRQRLERILNNLIDNAIRYSPGGGSIILAARVHPEKREMQISVSDQGVGIPAEQLDKVFERFHRVDSTLTREQRGTGLGLAIVKFSVEMHGGRVWVESQVGKGSTFYFTLPLAEPGRQ
jgi:two-component system phosphate regulon sensor histidine kinase PhoR